MWDCAENAASKALHSASKTTTLHQIQLAPIMAPLLTVKGYATLPGQGAGQRADADAVVVVVVVALRRGHGSGDGSKGLSSRKLRGSVFVFDVPKGRSPGLRDGPWHVLLLIIHPTPQR